jgi:hypothetical protein
MVNTPVEWRAEMTCRITSTAFVLLLLIVTKSVANPQAEIDSLREAAAHAVAEWVDQKQPGVGRQLAAEVGISEEAGNRIIAQMRLDQARCSINSWSKAPDDLEVSHLRRLAAGIGRSDDPTDYGVQVVQSMIDMGYSQDDLRDIYSWADNYYWSCIREGERLYMKRLEDARDVR